MPHRLTSIPHTGFISQNSRLVFLQIAIFQAVGPVHPVFWKHCRETGTLPSQRPAKNSPAYGLVKQVPCSTYLLVDGAEKVDDSACTWHGY